MLAKDFRKLLIAPGFNTLLFNLIPAINKSIIIDNNILLLRTKRL